MGVISITQRRETLGNIGATPMAHGVTNTDIGTVRHHSAGVYSPRYFARNSHAGDGAVQRGLEKLGDVFAGIALREDERQSDMIVRQVMDNLDRMDRDDTPFTPEEVGDDPARQHLLGERGEDGGYANPQRHGLRLRTGEGTRNLAEETDSTYGEVFNGIADSMGASASARRRAHERLSRYQLGRVDWAKERQAGEYRRMELAGANDQLGSFLAAYKNGNAAVVDDVFEARDKIGALEGKSARAMETDRQALAVAMTTDLVAEQTRRCSSPEDFDRLAEAVRNLDRDGTPLPDAIRRRLPDGGIGGKNQTAIIDSIKMAKRDFLTERKREAAQAEADEMDAVNGRLMAVHSEAMPEAPGAEEAHAMSLAAAYEREAANGRLTPARRLSYAKTAEGIRASLREDRRRAKNAAAARLEKMREATAKVAAASFEMGRYWDPEAETWVRMSATDMDDRARQLFASGAISLEQFYRVSAAAQGAEGEESRGLLDAFLSAAKKVAPDALAYNARTREFEVKVSDKVRRNTKIPDSEELPSEWKVAGEKGFFGGDPEEAATYADLADALNATRAWQKASNATEDQAVEHFLKMAAGPVKSASMRTIRARLDGEIEEARNIERNRRDAIRYRTRGANGSAFGR